MENRSTFTQIKSFILVACLGLSAASYAGAPAGYFTLQNNQLTISGGSGSSFSTQTATISADGVVTTIANVPSTNGVGIPSFAFTLVPNGVIPDGSYDFRVGVTIDDNANARRMEAKIDKLTLTVAGSTVTGTIPAAGNNLRVLGRDGGNTLQVDLTTPNNQQSGPITVSGGTVSFNASTLIDRIRSSTTTAFDTYILKEFDQPATYTYHIAVSQLSGGPATLQFGTTQPAFTALKQVGVDVSAPATFELLSSAFATDFNPAYFVKGQFNVVYIAPSSSGGGGGGTSTAVTQGTASLEQELASIPAIVAGTPPSADTVSKIETAVSNASNVAAQAAAAAAAGTLTPSQAIATLLQSNKAVELAGQAKQAGANSSTSTSTSVLTNIANVFSGLSTSGTTLTDNEKTQLAAEAKKAIDNAKALIKEGEGGTTQAELIALVDAGAQLLNNISKLNSNTVPDDVLSSVNALSSNAINNSLQGNSAAGNIDRNDPVAVRNFLQTNPAAKSTAVANTPKAEPSLKFTITFALRTLEQSCQSVDSQFLEAVKQQVRNASGSINSVIEVTTNCANLGQSQAIVLGGNVLNATSTPTISVAADGRFTYATSTDKYIGRSVIRLVPDSIPTGTSALPNGKTLLVQAGIATEVSPTALDEASFGAAVSSAGFQLSYNDNGSIAIDLGNNETFSGAFAYDNLGTATSCGALTFTAPTGSPTDADYAFIANCADGVKQRITPFANTDAFYTTLANEGINATTDRNTGIVTIPNIGNFKPSFFVTPLSLNDTAYYNATKNADGIAFRALDANGDGKTDYEIISATGVQTMYGL